MSALRDRTAFFVNVGQGAVCSQATLAIATGEECDASEIVATLTTVVTAADTVTPDASFTSPLLAIDKHRRGY